MVSEKVVASSINTDVIEEEPPKPSYRGLYRFTTKADLTILLPAIAVSIASGCLVPAFTILLGKIFTSFGAYSTGKLAGGDLEQQVVPYVIGICIVGAAAWGLGWANMALWLAFGENVARTARQRMMKGLLEKNMTWFDQKVVDNGVSGNMNKAIKYHCLPKMMA